jgi:hypothetical protein
MHAATAAIPASFAWLSLIMPPAHRASNEFAAVS